MGKAEEGAEAQGLLGHASTAVPLRMRMGTSTHFRAGA